MHLDHSEELVAWHFEEALMNRGWRKCHWFMVYSWK